MRPKAKRRYVLDASALLAYLQREPGYQRVRAVLDGGAVMSAVNLAEVYSKVVAAGLDLDETAAALRALGLRAVAFAEDDAHRCALLCKRARALALSLADRACLALGRRLGLPVVTADRAWTRIGGTKVEVIR